MADPQAPAADPVNKFHYWQARAEALSLDLKAAEARNEALLQALKTAKELVRNAQWIVHCGQHHQWKTLEQCTERSCKSIMAFLDSGSASQEAKTPGGENA